MDMCTEDVIREFNDVSAALSFIVSSIECHEAEGREFDQNGLACILKMVRDRSQTASDLCWLVSCESDSEI